MHEYNKSEIRIGGPGVIVEIDESLFFKVEHNRGRDTRRPPVWVLGMYLRASNTVNEQV